MRGFCMLVLCMGILPCHSEVTTAYRLAIRHGAEARYVYKVIDDEGLPVPDAWAHVCFRSYGIVEDNAEWSVRSGSNGMFEVAHRVNERVSVGADKVGYYHAHDEVRYLESPVHKVSNGRWQPYGEERTLVLKRIRNPHMMIGPARPRQRKIPAWGKWLGFDLERHAFLSPYGEGVHADVLLKFTLDERSARDWDCEMEVSFTNSPYAGAYQMRKDLRSGMASTYEADTNAVYSSKFVYRYSRDENGSHVDRTLGADDYLVFRIRTQVDSDGRLRSARYGKLYGPWQFADAGGVKISGVFLNVKDNEINLEDQRTVDLLKNVRRPPYGCASSEKAKKKTLGDE